MSQPDPIDEMVDGRGGIRPLWRSVLGVFAEFGEGELGERARRLDRVFDEEGGISLRPAAADGGWRCDLLPLPLSAKEFDRLAAGLAQRARLLQRVLGDLYGEQRLLAEERLPPALVYANPAFLRARREQPAGPGAVACPPLLQCYAADLLRGADGAWRVVADLVTNPAGIGHAQENRRLLARVMPEAFQPLAIRQLRPFFDLWQDSLQRLAPPGSGNPGVALLSPGSGTADWFEHMLLSRELSCALVEAGDLTMRAGQLYLKTLRGLEPLDVLLSRVPGTGIDPLDLGTPGAQGVPGLLDAVRQGTLRMVNDPGADILETPALMPFLAAAAETLLDEALQLESHPRLWLGDPDAAARVAAEPEGWVLGPAFKTGAASLPDIATAPIQPSMAPFVTEEGLQPRPILLRLFLAFDGTRWHVMPGGVARVVEGGVPGDPALRATGVAKDVWVFDDEQRTVLGASSIPHLPLTIRRTNGDLPGRVAENFFWLGRYLERLEAAARLVRITLSRLGANGSLPRDMAVLDILGQCLARADLAPGGLNLAMGTDPLVQALIEDMRDEGTMSHLVGEVTRLTESLRDRLTADMYGAFVHTLREAVEDLHRIETEPGWRSLEALGHAMIDIIRFTATVSGLAAENMVQGGGRLFLDLGRRIERAQTVATTIAQVLDRATDRSMALDDRLRLVLELCDSAITYRNRYLMVLQAAPVLDLVIADDGNPRGLSLQLAAISELLTAVAGVPEAELLASAKALIRQALALTERVSGNPDQAVAMAALPVPLRAIAEHIGDLSDEITRRYFALLPPRQFLGDEPPSQEMRGAA
jgi:uncharacterized circularly permuted ATP-grasp superfamily protein/uncharacterized alpha-E superfamily protein